MQQTSVVLDNNEQAELYQRHAPALLAYLLRQVTSRDDAEDLLLEVFLAALENRQFRTIPEHKQQAWLQSVARNKVADHYRHFIRHPRTQIGTVAETLYEREELEPESMALRSEEYAQLHRTLRDLPDSQQEILQLRFGHGLSCLEISTIVGKSEGSVRMLLSRTLRRLRDLYTKN